MQTNMSQDNDGTVCSPDAVGKTFEEAEEIIKRDYPDITVEKLFIGSRFKPGTPVTLDMRQDRVRVYVDEHGTVVAVRACHWPGTFCLKNL